MCRAITLMAVVAAATILVAVARAEAPAPTFEDRIKEAVDLAAAGKPIEGEKRLGQLAAELQEALKASPSDAHNLLLLGTVFSHLKREDDALRTFVRASQADPNLAEARYQIAVIQLRKGAAKTAVDQLTAAAKAAPQDWRIHARLVQAYATVGNKAGRDAEHKILFDLREKGQDAALKQAVRYQCDEFAAGGRKVIAYEYFVAEGERPVKYAFYVMDASGRKTDCRVTLGSYATLDGIAHEQNIVKEGQRLFHLDAYYASGEYKHFHQFKGEPAYDAVRYAAVQVVSRKPTPTGSVSPSGKGDTTITWDPGTGTMGLAALMAQALEEGKAADNGKPTDVCPIAAEPD